MTADTIFIRAFREADRARIKELTAASFSGVSMDQCIESRFGPLNGTTWQERKVKHIDADLAAPGGTALVAEDQGAVIGYVTVTMDPETRLGRIPNLAVDASYRGRGLGARLIQAALDHMREHGMRHAKIETMASNDIGQHLYPKMGFVEIARQVHFVREL